MTEMRMRRDPATIRFGPQSEPPAGMPQGEMTVRVKEGFLASRTVLGITDGTVEGRDGRAQVNNQSKEVGRAGLRRCSNMWAICAGVTREMESGGRSCSGKKCAPAVSWLS